MRRVHGVDEGREYSSPPLPSEHFLFWIELKDLLINTEIELIDKEVILQT